MSSPNHIVVFEHQKHTFNLKNNKEKEIHEALEKYHGNYTPFFKLIRNGVQFNQHVGVLKVGNTTIEVLPKADTKGEEVWRPLLIDMIKTIWGFNVKTSGNADLKLKSNSILDLYFELFVNELEFLLHRGLIKKYNKKEGNLYALKGALQFSKQISQNLTHQERFYVKYSNYDVNHKLHCILYKALKMIYQINNKVDLKSRIGNLLLNFPEMNDIKITESIFDKIIYDRKNQHYEKALQIAKLLLLNYHPDISKGKDNVLALMFDMNILWEQFIYIILKRDLKDSGVHVKAQVSKKFWQSESGTKSKMKPDIILEKDNTTIVLDTKWKNLYGDKPSPEDLRQMYAYHQYYEAIKTVLVYPGEEEKLISGNYFKIGNDDSLSNHICSIAFIKTHENIKEWRKNINSFVKRNLLNISVEQ